MYPLVGGKLRMESCRHHSSLPHQHGIVAAFCQDFYSLADPLDPRRANEDHLQRIAAERGGGFDDGGIDLASVGVAANRYVDGIQSRLMRVLDFLGQHDRPGASAERRLAVHEGAQFSKGLIAAKLQESARFAPRNDQAIDLVELLRLAHQYNLRAQFLQAAAMRIEIAL